MTIRRQLLDILSAEPRSVSSLSRELGLARADVEEHLHHLIRSARAAGHRIALLPAECRSCGFRFGEAKLLKPSRCPECHGTRILEAQLWID